MSYLTYVTRAADRNSWFVGCSHTQCRTSTGTCPSLGRFTTEAQAQQVAKDHRVGHVIADKQRADAEAGFCQACHQPLPPS